MNKKIFVIPAALLMVSGLASCNNGADKNGHLVTYDVAGGVCVASLSNSNRSAITKIEVPNAIGGKPVVEISKGAFKACPNLKSISLPFIGHKTNSDGIGGLFGYVFGDEMYDGGGAFTWQCYGLGNNYDDGITDYHEFAIPKSLQNVTITGGNYISAGAFSKCTTLRNITITNDNKATEIGNYAFYDCTSLKSFTIPNNVKTIGRKAFQRCYNLQTINIPDGVETIRHNAFSKCISAARATIPTSVTSMGKLVFEDFISGLIMTELENDPAGWDPEWANSTASIVYDYHGDSLIMDENEQLAICGKGNDRYFFLVQYIGEWKGDEGKITIPGEKTVNGLTLPLKKIGPSVFMENTNIHELTIEEGVEVIGAHAFKTCINLEKINLPESLKEIGAYAFYDCRRLGHNNTVDLVNVEKIDNCAFMNCFSQDEHGKYGLKNLKLSDNLKEIGDSAFENDELLIGLHKEQTEETAEGYELVIPKMVTKIGARAFFNTFKYRGDEDKKISTAKLTFEHDEDEPCNIAEVGDSAFELLGVSGRTKELYPQYSDTLQIYVDLGKIKIEKIPNRMFYLSYLGNVENFPVDTLKEVGEYAFYYTYGRSGYSKIKLGDNLTTIGNYAFCNCYYYEFNLFNNIEHDEFNIQTIGNYAFSSCYYSKNTELIIPDSVETIGSAGFNNCYSLTNIVFPDDCKVTRLESSVFASCTGLGKNDPESGDQFTFELPASINYVGGSAFASCRYLKHIVFKNTDDCITYVGGSAFSECNALLDVKYTLKQEGNPLSKCTSFGGSVYNNCYKLVEPYIPFQVTSIGSYVFNGCQVMTKFDIPHSVTTIGESAFSSCYALTEVTGGEGLTTINANAFNNCENLSIFNMPITVSTIANYAFSGCTSLGKDDDNRFILPSALTQSWTGSKGMGSNVFSDWTEEQTIFFRGANLTKPFDETADKIETLWGWTLEKKTEGGKTFYTCAASGSSEVHFEYLGQ